MVKHIKCFLIVVSVIPFFIGSVAQMQSQEQEPIAFVGHGAFFDQNGKQIEVTLEFVAKAQEWYRRKLLSSLRDNRKTEFASFERRLNTNTRARGQNRLVVQQHLLDWLVANSEEVSRDGRTIGKLNALKYALQWKLPDRPGVRNFKRGEVFKVNPQIETKLKSPEFKTSGVQMLTATENAGQAYLDECKAAGVPVPPPIGQMDPAGLTGWRSVGFIPQASQFIVGTPAEVRVFKSTSPEGMCIALPRYSDDTKTTVSLDGVICLGKATSKVCFWDNQMKGNPFAFPIGTKIPIGVPDLSINPDGLYQAGGAELVEAAGGMCTDCHAGQNPYIIHPRVDLGAGAGPLMGNLNRAPFELPMFSESRYDPLVTASWAQNQASHPQARVPEVCSSCHDDGGPGGAFPQITADLRGYCTFVLNNAIEKTMPPSSPGSQRTNPAVVAFIEECRSTANPNRPTGAGRVFRPNTLPARKR